MGTLFPLTAGGWLAVGINTETILGFRIVATHRYNCHSLVTRLGNFVGLWRCRHAFVPVMVSLAGQPVDGGIFIPMPSSCCRRICYAHYMCVQYLPVDSIQTSVKEYFASHSTNFLSPLVKDSVISEIESGDPMHLGLNQHSVGLIGYEDWRGSPDGHNENLSFT